MLASNPLIVVGVFFLILFFAALIFGLVIQRRRGASESSASSAADWMSSISSPTALGEERMASFISETIEDLVRERMQKDPTLQGQKIDFGTSSDGTLEIWIDDERYLDVAAIPNEKIRAIIQEAVKAYNEGNA
jgi:hypothetical protein